MEQVHNKQAPKLFWILLTAALGAIAWLYFVQLNQRSKAETLYREKMLLNDSLQMAIGMLHADGFLLKGELDSANAIFEQWIDHAWVDSLKADRLSQLDSIQKSKVVVQQIVRPVVTDNGNRSLAPPDNDSIIEQLSKTLDRDRGRRDSLQNLLNRDREKLRQAMEAFEKNSEWQYLKFFKKQKGMHVNYVGQVKGGQAHGKGIGIYSSGSVYKGEWQNGLRHGQGVFEWADGEKYEGEYLQDMRHGYGVYVWSNGLRYEGEWRNDRREGEGVLYDKKNKVVNEGKWANDKPVK